MFKLYSVGKENVEVYSMIPKKEELENYKRREFQSINEDERVLVASTNDTKVLESKDPTIWSRELNYTGKNNSGVNLFHSFTNYEWDAKERERQRNLFEQYFSGAFNESDVKRVQGYSEILLKRIISYYLLLTKREYSEESFSTIFKMDDIISLPKSLYLLHLLQKERFFELEDEDLKEQLSLFEVKLSHVMSIQQLQKAYCEGLVYETFESSMNKFKSAQCILEKIK